MSDQYLKTKDWLDVSINSLDLPGSPWHTARRDVLKKLAKKLEEKNLFEESQLVSHELRDGISVPCHDSHESKQSREKFVRTQKMMKPFLSIAAREAGYSANLDRINQTEACATLIKYIQNILKVNYKMIFEPSDGELVVEHNKEIELLGSVLSHILEKDSRQLHKISLRVKDCTIPHTLRKSFYQLTLQKMDEDKYGVTKRDEALRQDFADKVKLGMRKLGIKDPTKSPLQHMMQSSIIESYETFPSLNRFSKNMKFQKSSSAIVNILYTATQKYKYEYILWLFPLQFATQGDGSQGDMFELAMQLDKFTRCCYEMSNTNKILLEVWRCLLGSKLNKIQYVMQHLQSIGIEISIDTVKLILQQDMGSVTESAAYPSDIFKQGAGKFTSLNKSDNKSLFAAPHPVLSLRHWIRYLFVGSTSFSVTMFLFDQFFLNSWDYQAILKACLCFIYLISDELIKSSTAEEVCTKMLMELKRVESSDFQVTWRHLARHHHDFFSKSEIE